MVLLNVNIPDCSVYFKVYERDNMKTILETDDYFQVQKILDKSKSYCINVNISNNYKSKDFELILEPDEEFIYFKRNVINIMSSYNDDDVKNQYKIICVGKKTKNGSFQLRYYNLINDTEIESSDISYFY